MILLIRNEVDDAQGVKEALGERIPPRFVRAFDVREALDQIANKDCYFSLVIICGFEMCEGMSIFPAVMRRYLKTPPLLFFLTGDKEVFSLRFFFDHVYSFWGEVSPEEMMWKYSANRKNLKERIFEILGEWNTKKGERRGS